MSKYSIKGKTYKIEYVSMQTICFFYGKYDHYTKGCAKKAKLDKSRNCEVRDMMNAGEEELLEQKLTCVSRC